ncbi:MAG: hypothetical protein ACOCYU_03470 [Brevefilum sp.]
MIKKSLIAISLIVVLLTACQTKPTETPATSDEAFELYLVADEEMRGPDLKDSKLSELPLVQTPLISTDDVVNYMWDHHVLNITEEAYQKILFIYSAGVPTDGLPFVVMSDGERIYAGAFWPAASSLSFDGVVIPQPFDPANMPLFIALGYPTPEAFTGEDPRDNPRLQNALEREDLLYEEED